jgi:hypothetical protein
VKVEKKVEKKAVVKVEVKKGDNRYFGLTGTESQGTLAVGRGLSPSE